MKKPTFLSILSLAVLIACNSDRIEKGTPDCVGSKIAEFNANSTCNDPHVDEYSFQEKTVYVFEPGTCGADMTSEVIDADCKTLGYLGGITGNTKINGEEFSKASFNRIIWKK